MITKLQALLILMVLWAFVACNTQTATTETSSEVKTDSVAKPPTTLKQPDPLTADSVPQPPSTQAPAKADTPMPAPPPQASPQKVSEPQASPIVKETPNTSPVKTTPKVTQKPNIVATDQALPADLPLSYFRARVSDKTYYCGKKNKDTGLALFGLQIKPNGSNGKLIFTDGANTIININYKGFNIISPDEIEFKTLPIAEFGNSPMTTFLKLISQPLPHYSVRFVNSQTQKELDEQLYGSEKQAEAYVETPCQ